MLRERLGVRSAKDGCSPQGQCGCCTVWVDGAPRVSCVTPARRVAGRQVTTLEGLPDERRERWAEGFAATGGSQCGFCTPGIIMRLAALEPAPGAPPAPAEQVAASVDRALLAHLCRCTGWQTVGEAAAAVLAPDTGSAPPPSALSPSAPSPSASERSEASASARATLEGGSPQRVGPDVALGHAGFADDGAPADALVAVPDTDGGYAVAGSVTEARALAGKVQGRRTTLAPGRPVDVPAGPWAITLATSWVEPAYLEPDASWCTPGGTPSSPLANGGAFGGKRHSPVAAEARRLADLHGRPVRVLWSREDVVRRGPKRPPVAVGIRADGTGVLRVGMAGPAWADAEWEAVRARVAAVAPGLELRQVTVAGPPVSADLRGAVWVEAAVVEAARRAGGAPGEAQVDVPVEVVAPGGGRAVARCAADGSVEVTVAAGAVLDAVVLRSYVIGAVHQAVSWVTSEGLAVDADGVVGDLTVRSFGILPARATPTVDVRILEQPDQPAVAVSEAVVAAVAAARWLADGLAPAWPTGVGRTLLP